MKNRVYFDQTDQNSLQGWLKVDSNLLIAEQKLFKNLEISLPSVLKVLANTCRCISDLK